MELELINRPIVLDSNAKNFDLSDHEEEVLKDVHDDQQLETTKQEMGEVRQENQRLKTILARISKDYQSLQTQFFEIVQQEESKKQFLTPHQPPPPTNTDLEEEPVLVCLSLGTSSTKINKEEIKAKSNESDQITEQCLTLGLSSGRNESVLMNLSPDNSSDEPKEEEEEAGEPWPPSKILKNLRSDSGGDLDVSQQAHAKKARVSVRARCDTPTMNDGCQWRKYGQKVSKGNPCPRAYYRCSVAPSCPVRKQVQRCAEDMPILITTYEGNHNHPLPISATAMASATSAAACMLMSGSSAARPGITSPLTSSSVAASSLPNTTLQGINFNLPDNSRARNFYLHNTSISSSPSYPTITLDLTAPPSSAVGGASQFSRFSSTFSSAPRYTSTGFSFSSDSNASHLSSWSNTPYLSYGSQLTYNKNSFFQPLFLQQTSSTTSTTAASTTAAPNVLTDTIAKAITSDPSFQSALASAITSYVGAHGAQGGGGGGTVVGESLVAPLAQSLVNGCSSNFLTRSNTTLSNSQHGSFPFMQPSALSSSKSTSASPVDNRENTS